LKNTRGRLRLIDYFSLFKGLFVVLGVFGIVMLFELMLLLQGIKYYKTGKIVEGFRSQDMFNRKCESYDSSIAFGYPIGGIILFVSFNIALTLVEGAVGIVLVILHSAIIITLVYWYWKKKTIEANLAEYNVDENQEIAKL
jgi:hypothetical protein